MYVGKQVLFSKEKIEKNINQKVKNAMKNFYFLIFLFMLIITLFLSIATYAAATPSTPRISTSSDLERGLSDSENEEIEEFTELKNMVSSIFEVTDNKGTEDLSNPIQLSYYLISRCMELFDKIDNNSVYKFLVGLALILLVANFSISMYEDSSMGLDMSFKSKNMIRKYMRFIAAFLLIVLLKGIVLFILGFFRFLLKFMIESTNNNFLEEVESLEGAVNPERIAYEILKENGIVKGDTLLDDVIVRSKESAVRSSYMIPWVFSWISKMVLLVIVFVNSVLLLVHSMFYVVSIGDFFSDFYNSKFMEYTKTLISIALEESVIILVLYICNLFLNPFLSDLLKNGVVGGGLSFINLAMIFTGVQFARVIVIVISSNISKRIIGVA